MFLLTDQMQTRLDLARVRQFPAPYLSVEEYKPSNARNSQTIPSFIRDITYECMA